MMKLLGSLSLLAAALSVGQANATVLTFDDAFDEFYAAPVETAGYVIGNPSNEEQHFHLVNSEYYGDFIVNNGTGVLLNDLDTSLEIALSGGGLFTLGDFDAASSDTAEPFNSAFWLMVTGYRAGAAVGSFIGQIGVDGYRTYSGKGFGQVDRVSFDGEDGGFALDNISLDKVAAPVPEPATWTMMIAGFGAAGMSLRRRRGARRSLAVG